MKKYMETLKKCSLFKGISDDDLIPMLGCLGAEVRSYSRNGSIFTEGEPVGKLGIVLDGTVQIVRNDYYGNRSILAAVEESQLFGESFVCAEIKKLPVNVVAAQESTVMLLDGDRVIHSCKNSCEFHNRIIFNLMKTVAEKNLLFNRKLEVLSQRTTREKLMTYLMQQAKAAGTDSFEIPYDRQALADFLEVDRSGLSAEISKLRNDGVIKCRKNQFTLH